MHRARDEREGTAAAYLPDRLTLPTLKEAAAGCRACPLWENGTRTVFGEGRPTARVREEDALFARFRALRATLGIDA